MAKQWNATVTCSSLRLAPIMPLILHKRLDEGPFFCKMQRFSSKVFYVDNFDELNATIVT